MGKKMKKIPSNFLVISGDSKHFSFFLKKNLKNRPPPGGRGGSPQFLFYPKSCFFCDVKPHVKFRNPTITPTGTKVTWRKKKEK